MPSMRFYVVSIVAIFIALGVGIYIGFSIDSHEIIFEQQENLVDIVESQFTKLTRENNDLNEKNILLKENFKFYEDYLHESYDYLIKDELIDKNIVLLSLNDDYISNGFAYDLELAGAKVTSLVTIKGELENREVDNLIRGLIEPKNEDFKELIQENKIEVLGNNYNKPDSIVLIGGFKNKDLNKEYSKKIISDIKKEDIQVLGVEKSTALNSTIDNFRELGIPTVDNIDTKFGKVALILSINDKYGNYGIKSTAESLIPKLK